MQDLNTLLAGGVIHRQLRLVELIEPTDDVNARPARPQRLTHSDPAHGLGNRRRSQDHIAGQLWPRRKRAVEFNRRRRQAWRQLFSLEKTQQVRNHFPATHLREAREIQFAQQTVQDRTFRLQVETFDVHQAAIAGCHQHRNPTRAGAFSHDGLDVQRIGLLATKLCGLFDEAPAVC